MSFLQKSMPLVFITIGVASAASVDTLSIGDVLPRTVLDCFQTSDQGKWSFIDDDVKGSGEQFNISKMSFSLVNPIKAKFKPP